MTDKELFIKWAKEQRFSVNKNLIEFETDNGNDFSVDICEHTDETVFNLWCKISVECLTSEMLIAEYRNLEQIKAIITNLL